MNVLSRLNETLQDESLNQVVVKNTMMKLLNELEVNALRTYGWNLNHTFRSASHV
jgi:hypothetical protein